MFKYTLYSQYLESDVDKHLHCHLMSDLEYQPNGMIILIYSRIVNKWYDVNDLNTEEIKNYHTN